MAAPELKTHYSCCFGNYNYGHNTVVASYPVSCMQLVCIYGNIEFVTLDDECTRNCCVYRDKLYGPQAVIYDRCYPKVCQDGKWVSVVGGSPDPKCCWYRDRYIENYHYIRGVCAGVYCRNGALVPTHYISNQCSLCEVYDDPHFRNYKNFRFDYHLRCNYSISQIGKTVEPESGVFAQFDQCWLASCLSTTTIREDENTIIQIGTNGGLDTPDIYTIEINGCSYTVPLHAKSYWITCDGITYDVLAWRHYNGIRILGKHFLVQHCKHSLNIWVLPSADNPLHGLCGPVDTLQPDKFIGRDDTLYDLTFAAPDNWGESWTAKDQSVFFCVASSKTSSSQVDVTSACPDDVIAVHNATCNDYLKELPGALSIPEDEFDCRKIACALDLCFINNTAEQNVWLKEVGELFGEITDIVNNTMDLIKLEEASTLSPEETTVISE